MDETTGYALHLGYVPELDDDLEHTFTRYPVGPRPNMVRMAPRTMRQYNDELMDLRPASSHRIVNIPPHFWTQYPSCGNPSVVETHYGRILFVSDRNIPEGRWVLDYHNFQFS